MLKINYDKLKTMDLGIPDLDDIYYEIDNIMSYLLTHNKNYTKAQFEKLQIIAEFLGCIDIE